MSAGQRQTIDAILRQNAYPVDSDVSELRRRTKEQASAQPLPAEVTVTAGELGGVPMPRSPSTAWSRAMLSCTSTPGCTCWVTPMGLPNLPAVRLAGQAAHADVQVTLDITPGVPHVFQGFHAFLDEATEALDRTGQFLSAQLADGARVTA